MKRWILIITIMVFLNSVHAACEEGQIDINSASKKELMKIKWVGDSTADKIIDYRVEKKFESLRELAEIPYITENRIDDMMDEEYHPCVDNSRNEENKIDIESKEEEENSEYLENDDSGEKEVKKLEKTFIPVKDNETERQEDVELETINLNPKNIKSDGSDRDYAWYGLIAFSILLMFLFSFRVMKSKEISIPGFKRYKNEFID